MAIQMSDNFKLRAEKFLDDRESFKTVADMKAFNIGEIPDGFITYCEETVQHYKLCKLGVNDPTLGYWQVLSSGSGSGSTGGTVDEQTIINKALAQSKTYTNAEISKLVADAPMNLNTLKELADATTSNNQNIGTINNALPNKADKTDVYEADGRTPKFTTPAQVPSLAPKITWTDATTDKVGNINAGFVPPEGGISLVDFLYKLTHRPIAATISTSLSPSTATLEQGTSVTNPTITATVNNGTSTPTQIRFYRNNEVINTQNYIAKTQTYTFQDTYTVSANTTYKTEVVYTLDGTGGTNTGIATYSFVYPSYLGTLNTPIPIATDVVALTKNIFTSKNATKVFTQTTSWMCFAYPASFGDLTSIKDMATGYQLIGGWKKETMLINGQSYNVYLSGQCTVNNYSIQFS